MLESALVAAVVGGAYSHPDCRRLSDGENGHGALRLDVRSWSSNPQSCIDRRSRLVVLPWRAEPVLARLRGRADLRRLAVRR